MTEKDNDIQRLIEAAEKSVQDGREFRTAPLGTSLFIEKEAEEQKEEQVKTEWDEWGKQIGGRIDEEERVGGKALGGILSIAAVILAIIVLSVFFMNINKQQITLSQKPRMDINSITGQKDSSSSTSESPEVTSTSTGKVAVHNGVPSAQAPPDYKPLERDQKTGRIIRKRPEPPPEPAVTPSYTPTSPNGTTKPGEMGEKPSVESGTEGGEYQPSWMKESPPPKTTPQGEPILIQ